MPMLLIIFPLTRILGPIGMSILALSICLILSPLTFINVPIRMEQSSLSICLVLSPFPFVLAAIRPDLFASALSHALKPFSLVCYTVIQLYFLQFHNCVNFQGWSNKFIVFLGFSLTQQIGAFASNFGYWFGRHRFLPEWAGTFYLLLSCFLCILMTLLLLLLLYFAFL